MLERRTRQLQNLLTINECLSNPCQNGGTCIDSFNGYFCQCPKNWEGLLCNVDVNECSHFAGTDLGCQNGATCINRPGTYECVCASNWLGVHCTQRSDDCTISSSEELCGHGTCVNTKASGGKAYKCICDQGWTTLGVTGPCTVDVDECGSSSRPACSMNPVVQCINVPGSFFCGPCPQGYTGNGYYCTDIDECQVNNGGCSVNPLVQCINTQGSRICGQCPPGYQGDGKFCTFLGVCSVNNGGCHPLARCVDNPRISQTYVECICPTGYLGSGMGPTGCVPGSGGGAVVPGGGGGGGSSGQVNSNPCIGVQCVHGSCLSTSATTYMCLCLPGFTGQLCELAEDPCLRRPCQNGGTCARDGVSGYRCICADGYTGLECQEQQQSCGGTLTALSGTLQFPASGSLEYGHNLNCPWLIITNTSKVLQVNFTRFQLEPSPQCEFDFLQIHDGRTSGAHMLGRYCGNKMPPNITSTHNKLYLWFRTDQSHSREGFSLTWNSVDPVCGTALLSFTTHGRLQSPGSPGMYPNNRDCYWTLVAPYGRRIQFSFYTMQIEASANCSNDFLEIHAGFETGQVLNRYCNTSHPRPLTTPGHVATLYFHTNDKRNDAGFQISYTSVESFPGCGGTLSAPSGEISSPNHPNTYLENIDCDWHIQMPHNERIHLTFLTFSLENSMGCFFDYLEIREGVEEDSPVIGRYCGTSLPPPYTSTRNELIIHFSSDFSMTGDGFRIKYESLCGGLFSEPSGVLTSPYYPNSYPASRTCIYEIALEPGKAVELCFQDFEVEDTFSPPCRYDYLQIRDGHNENATLLGQYCGGQDQFPTPCITSQYNYLWLKFVTDNSIRNRGFYANYSSIDVQCGGILKGDTGTIQSPNYPLYYLHGQKCQWVIVGRPGTVVKLTWESFSLEGRGYTRTCSYDKIMVFDNSTIPGHGGLMGTFCGSTLPPVLTTTDNTMTIVFTTDLSGSREGFSATYTLMDVSTLCGGTFFSSKGSLQSPNYPNWYPHNKDCTYVINVPTGQQIKLNVTDFELEGGTNCNYDFLEIRNGGTNLSPLIGKYCGTSIPRSIPSLSHQLYLHFKTDGSGRRRGFKITWDGTATGCGGVITTPSGSIISPNYPQPYGHSSECFWRISVSQGSAIQLVFVDLDLEGTTCYFDYLEVYDGRDTSAKKIGRYCSASASPLTIVSSNNNLYLKFRSDPSFEGRGFHIRYETVCNRLVKGYSGVIESPNFPANYGDSLDCTWNIMAPKGNKINVTFSHFSLEPFAVLWYWHSSDDLQETCRFDYVEIKEGRGSSAPDTMLMSKKCGTDMPERIHSSKDHVYVHFVSDESRSASGFRLEWIVNGCGGVLTKPTGTFSSPNYPWGYPKDTECDWLITVDWNHSIEVTIKNFSMENMRDCFFDSLSLYSGTDDSGALLHQFCHSNPEEETFTSSGNSLFVKFETDLSFQGKGFTASYRQVPIRCGGKFTTASGTIHSPNYPQNYDVNEDCQWLIEVNPNYVVWFQFMDFDLSYSSGCQHTFVKIYDGNSTSNNTLLFHDCGNNMPSVTNFTSTGNQMLIHMRADSFLTAKGFRANFSIACGARIIAKDTGVISINNALNKEHNENCSWIIIAENPEDHVTLTINILDVTMYIENDDDHCPWYFIELRDGQDVDAPLIGSYCGNRAPPHITTQGSALFVHAVSGYIGHYGTFSATYSVLSSVCGGNMSSEHGSFASPGYPNSYPTESDCEWFITTSPGNRVMLTFSMFELELGDYCNEDYVEVRKGSGMGPLIGIYCGSDIPSNLTAASSLWIKFRSTGTGTAPGFVADYSLLHGNDLSGSSGQIASPMYPRPYQREEQFHWRITVENSRAISITFSDFFIDSYSDECYYAFLAIYDGFDETGPLLSKSCGANIPASVTSSSNIIYIELSTGGSRLGAYFLLNWLQVERYISNPYPTSPPIPGCGGMINMEIGGNRTAETYTLISPGYPEGYDINLNCEWIFETTPTNHLSIYFQNMDLESTYNCYYDYVKVYTGVEGMPEWDLLNTVCLPNATYQRRIETTNLMKIVFRSDSYTNKTGFRATVRIECGGSLTGPNGVIDMRNESRALYWISRYSPLQCEWNVTVRTGKTILVNFIDFNIPSQDSNHCAESNIVLRNGISRNSPMLGQGRYCGNNPGTQFETSGNHLMISFKGLTSEAIFKLSYSEKSMSCGGHFSLSSENSSIVISSPNYPNIPQPHTECEWVFMAPAGERIHMDFLERFDITYSYDCRQAFLELRDGGTISSQLIDKFCRDKPSSQYTTSNMLYVRYFTDVTDPKNGFKANISIDTCGGTYRGMEGLIRLPTYPGQYPNNLNCSWQIAGPPDHYLTIWFDELSMPYSSNCTGRDSVTVSEMQTQNVSVYEPFWRWRTMSYFPSRFSRLTGYLSPTFRTQQVTVDTPIVTYCESRQGMTPPINSSMNEVNVRFQSFPRQTSSLKRGFSLRYNVSQETCGGLIEGSSGIFQSPGYPSTTGYRRYCRWEIVVPIGRRVKVELLDFDLENSMVAYRHRLVFLDSLQYMIKVLYARDTPEVVRSSGNKMTVLFSSFHNVGHRGFKARFSSDELTVCGGDLNADSGFIQSPSNSLNLTRYSCEWERTIQGEVNKTFVINLVNGTFTSPCYYRINTVAVMTRNERYTPLAEFCSNYTGPNTLALPFMDIVIETSRVLSGDLDFTIRYSVSNCGGILSGPLDVVSSPNGANGKYPPNTACAWSVAYPEGSVVNVTFVKMKLHSNCDGDYLLIRNGPRLSSPLLNKYCGTNIPQPIISQSSNLWIEFYSDQSNEDEGFILRLEPVFEGCGGVLHARGSVLKTPKFPENYLPNTECLWDIRASDGYTISLKFIERFEIETSAECVNDFVEVFDYVNNEYTSLGKYCDRTNHPQTINSTGSQMRVLFRSNADKNGSGFKAVVDFLCGGIITKLNGRIISPGFPQQYDNYLQCNYTIIPPSESVVQLEFADFDLEGGNQCFFDWVKIYEEFFWSTELQEKGTYCGSNTPPPMRGRKRIVISFKTDGSVRRRGFMINLSSDDCGSNLTSPAIIHSPRFMGNYLSDVNCRWNITAPAGKNIVLRFSEFVIEYNNMCIFDYVAVYDGNEINDTLTLGILCGNLTESPPILHSTGNQMVVLFKTDYSGTYQGFRASVTFQTACGGTIQLENTASLQPIATSDPFLTCRWLVLTSRDKQIQFKLTSYTSVQCSNTTANNCSCSYIEVRDGPGSVSELMKRYCGGETLPLPLITSSANQMWVSFVSESGIGGGNFQATVTAVTSICGSPILNVTSTIQELTSPGYPSNYPPNIRCRWLLTSSSYGRYDLHFSDLDIEQSTDCTEDFLSIEGSPRSYDRPNRISEGLGDNLIFSGTITNSYHSLYYGMRFPEGKTTYCGNHLPLDYYTDYNNAQVTFKSNNAVQRKGFKLRYALAGCNRNYTSIQGRIYVDNLENECIITIQVPANRTIALYFLSFNLYSQIEQCADSALEVRDGLTQSSTLLARLCGYERPNPIFSTGNTLRLHKSGSALYGTIDVTYTTNDQSRGCGGVLFNYGGVFTSPFYPNNYRNNSVCRWDVSVPIGTQPLLHFQVFDIGIRATCETDFVEIYDINSETNEETFIARYCGGDNPAMHEGSTGTVSVRYTTSIHNGGTGWVAAFMGKIPGSHVDQSTYW